MKLPISKSWKEIFVVESSLIDPQPGYPCNGPGDLMYDNHMSALDFVLSKGWELNENTPLDVHRFLTRNIDFYEFKSNSGQYRTCEVRIGNEICPSPYIVPDLMKNEWFKITKSLIDLVYADKMKALECAWISHHIFEIIHPFIDGNGRTGRLLFNKVLKDCGEEPRVIYFEDRFIYYDSIQNFKEYHWNGKKFINLDKYLTPSL
jgi:Fic family protein